MTAITVQSIKPPAEGRKRGVVTTTDGRELGVWREKIAMFVAGTTYDVEIEESDVNGRLYENIKTARRLSAPAGSPARGTAPVTGPASKDEQIFVQGILQALIRAGEVKKDKTELWEATQTLRGLWRHTFGAG